MYRVDSLESDVFYIWDMAGAPPWCNGPLILWRSYASNNSVAEVSIPKIVEEHAEILKAQYLKYIYELGNRAENNRTVIDKLIIRKNFSYWWMTMVAEKSVIRENPPTNDAIRLLAFQHWQKNKKIKKIFLFSSNESLYESLRLWCLQNEIRFISRLNKNDSTTLTLPYKIYEALPISFQGAVSFFHYFYERWKLIGIGIKGSKKLFGKATIVSYLSNIDFDELKRGRYKSHYWTKLPEKLKNKGLGVNWLHLYMRNSERGTVDEARQIIYELNEKNDHTETHFFLDSFLSFKVGLSVFRDWLFLVRLGFKLDSILSDVKSGDLILWPLFRKDWYQSMMGSKAILNLMYLNLFESALNFLPSQKFGFYLYENQPWEASLIYAWRANNHKSLIGVQHSTVAYWDTRYFYDSRAYDGQGYPGALPLPELVAVNGLVAYEMFSESGFPKQRLAKVEALRYLNLNQEKDRNFHDGKYYAEIRLLVLTDYIDRNSKKQLTILDQAIKILNQKKGFILTHKPHPLALGKEQVSVSMQMTTTEKKIFELYDGYDIAYCSATTSAAVDAYCLGMSVVVFIDGDNLNLSPLRGIPDINFVATPNELVKMLMGYVRNKSREFNLQHYFDINPDLNNWDKLLEKLSSESV